MSAARGRLPGEASGLRHLRWSREVLATLEAHIEQRAALPEADREALRDEARALGEAVQALSGAVKAYRDFLERVRVRYRGRVRAAAHLVETSGDASGRLEAALAELAALEATQRRPLKEALTEAKGRLRAAMRDIDARLGRRFSPAFVESLYPELAGSGDRVADDGDPDDDAAARA